MTKIHHGRGFTELFLWGIWGHKQAERSSSLRTVGNELMSRPGSSQTLNRQMAPRGWWGDRQESEVWAEGKRVHSRMEDICYTMFHVPMETGLNPQPPSRSCSTHSPRAHSMIADRRRWRAGLSSFAAAPHSCCLTLCPPHL